MEYSLIAIFSFILGLLIYHFLFNKSEPVNFDGLLSIFAQTKCENEAKKIKKNIDFVLVGIFL